MDDTGDQGVGDDIAIAFVHHAEIVDGNEQYGDRGALLARRGGDAVQAFEKRVAAHGTGQSVDLSGVGGGRASSWRSVTTRTVLAPGRLAIATGKPAPDIFDPDQTAVGLDEAVDDFVANASPWSIPCAF